MVQFPKNQFTKPLGPSLGANRMMTRGMTITKKWMCEFFNICPQRAVLMKFKFDHFVVFCCLRLLFPKEKFIKILLKHTIPWTLALFYHNTSFTSPTAKPFGPCLWTMHALKHVFLGSWIAWSQEWSRVNWSGPKASATSNCKFYRTLGWLHGPWCKQPLMSTRIFSPIMNKK